LNATFKISGLQSVKDQFSRVAEKVSNAAESATLECLDRIDLRAKINLARDIYERPDRPEFYPDFTDELMNSMEIEPIVKTLATVFGRVKNTSPHAIWIAYGTETHFIGPVQAAALKWIDGHSGETLFDSRGHWVSGIGDPLPDSTAMAPVPFLENALVELFTTGVLTEVYERHIRKALK